MQISISHDQEINHHSFVALLPQWMSKTVLATIILNNTLRLHVVLHSLNLSTQETEASRYLWIWDQFSLHTEFQIIQEWIVRFFQLKKKRKEGRKYVWWWAYSLVVKKFPSMWVRVQCLVLLASKQTKLQSKGKSHFMFTHHIAIYKSPGSNCWIEYLWTT